MAWFRNGNARELRHECRHEDGLGTWGFRKADRMFGMQELVDGNVRITTEHVFANRNGSSMVLRVNATRIHDDDNGNDDELSLLFTLSSAATVPISVTDHHPERSGEGLRGDEAEVKTLDGKHTLFVNWGEQTRAHGASFCTQHTSKIRHGKTSPELLRTHYSAWAARDDRWRVSDRLKRLLLTSADHAREVARNVAHVLGGEDAVNITPLLNNRCEDRANSVALQRSLTVPFSVTVTLSPSSGAPLSALALGPAQASFEEAFRTRFPAIEDPARHSVAQAALSNTIASVAYFHGSVMLDDGSEMPQGELLTGMPSRSFFPRGFFWDEGFHQLLVSRFDPDLAREVIASWLTRFDANGWVAREQILGSEAVERVPPQFRMQNRTFANPPTFLFAIQALMDDDNEEEDRGQVRHLPFFKACFDTFLRHRNWMIRTQQAGKQPGLFAWKGRTPDGRHTLTSGIDDYPRGLGGAQHLEWEAHVDLISWIACEELLLARLGARIPSVAQSTVEELQRAGEARVDTLLQKHWNARVGFFSDLGVVNDRGSIGLVPHIGYVGLMPFALKLIPVTPEHAHKIRSIARYVGSPEALRAEGVGIRSLAKNDAYFGRDEDYWRGAIWVNINYLCIDALDYYAAGARNTLGDSGLANELSELARAIRADVVGNVLKRYREEGFLFENYDGKTGAGRGTRPFTGWTALVVLMM